MRTLKLFSKGDDVKLLQERLNISADGIFGLGTQKAVMAFQAKNGLRADGIVGAKTWELLLPKKAVDEEVVYSPLSVHITKCLPRTIKYIAIHFTAGSRSTKGTALNVKKVFESRSASADFCVDDETMVQFNPDLTSYYCWAVGDKKYNNNGGTLYLKATNKNTVSIEICSTLEKGTSAQYPNHTGWSLSEAAVNQALKLTKILMKKYNIPKENVIRHYDVSGKLCPGIIGWNNEYIMDPKTGKNTKQRSTSDKWLDFKSKL